MGRFLRYEPARAFRTLLISYRSVHSVSFLNSRLTIPHPFCCLVRSLYIIQSTQISSPMKYLPGRSSSVTTSTEASQEGTWAALDLPIAMKMWKNRNSRYVHVAHVCVYISRVDIGFFLLLITRKLLLSRLLAMKTMPQSQAVSSCVHFHLMQR